MKRRKKVTAEKKAPVLPTAAAAVVPEETLAELEAKVKVLAEAEGESTNELVGAAPREPDESEQGQEDSA